MMEEQKLLAKLAESMKSQSAKYAYAAGAAKYHQVLQNGFHVVEQLLYGMGSRPPEAMQWLAAAKKLLTEKEG